MAQSRVGSNRCTQRIYMKLGMACGIALLVLDILAMIIIVYAGNQVWVPFP